DHQDRVTLLDTTYPAGRHEALQWTISSELDGKIPVEIRYFTSGITWNADYVGIANEDETRIDITGYVRVRNQSGELYDNTQTRLVVGTINLVEKIADLARRPPAPDPMEMPQGETRRSRVKEELEMALESLEETAARLGPAPTDKPKSVKKQGLSEYFLFTIEGREDIRHNEPKRLVALKVEDVPQNILYKLSDRNGHDRFIKFYRFKNQKLLDEAGEEKELSAMENLGLSPLPDGEVRLFSEYANKDLAYAGGASVKYIPIGDRVEINGGPDDDILLRRRLKDKTIRNVVARQYKRRLDNTFVLYYDLIDYDETYVYQEDIVSGKSVPAKTEIERRFDDNVVLWGNGPQPDDWEADQAGVYVDLH
ncbi:MAG: hypothetical protein AAF492_30860, partial [Verrucomicrobiota bacterium]